jgi:hypothetical protein
MWDRHSVVSTEMFCGLDSSGFEIRMGKDVFLFSTSVHRAPATNPISRKMGTSALSWDKSTGAWR